MPWNKVNVAQICHGRLDEMRAGRGNRKCTDSQTVNYPRTLIFTHQYIKLSVLSFSPLLKKLVRPVDFFSFLLHHVWHHIKAMI